METTATNNQIIKTETTSNQTNTADNIGRLHINIGGGILRYGLVAVLLFFGAFKFTAEEAAAIEPLVRNSPLMSWMFIFLTAQGASILIGITEIILALLIVTRQFLPLVSAIGSMGAIVMFLITLTFLFSTPGMWMSVSSFPLPVPTAIGGFLAKDLFLLGAAIYTAGEAFSAHAHHTPTDLSPHTEMP